MNIRPTKIYINLNNLKYNIKKIIKNYHYKYYFGVVKANCYGHGLGCIKTIIDSGCNYLATATLEEALDIRKINKTIPILCLGIIPIEDINMCINNNITITISNLEYAKKLSKKNITNLKCHIKINSGMNRLGINNKADFNKTYNLLKQHVEGIYTHIYNASSKKDTMAQYEIFKTILNDIDIIKIPIIHIGASEATINYNFDIANGCRLGIIMYGLVGTGYKSTYKLESEIIQINDVDGTVGYNALYHSKNTERIAIIPIGYADGIIRRNTGREVYIKNKKYPIIGNICMDMLFVKVDKNIKIGDKVTLLKDNNHINEVANYLDTINYEIVCSISNRVPRIYK